jgi:ribosomal protein L16/L10AE
MIIYVPEDGVETAKKACEVAGTKLPMKTRIIVEASVAPQIPAGA